MPRIDRPTRRPTLTLNRNRPADAAGQAGQTGQPSVPASSSGTTDSAANYQGGGHSPGLPSRDASLAETKKALESYFAPYDDPIKKEIALIEEVIAAKRADPRSFPDGENPYSIKYAVYNLRNPEVIRLLGEAHNSGVDVQVLVEDHQFDPAKTWNTFDEDLKAAGFDFAETHKGLTDAQKQELDLISIEGSGLMHLKTRIFTRPDPATGQPQETVVTGSMNPGDSAPFNNETLHIVSDPVLIERYKAKYDAVFDDDLPANKWVEGAPINVLFTPVKSGPNPADKILELIKNEDEAIFMSVFTLRDIRSPKHREGLVKALKEAKDRGVDVCVITDRKMSDGVDAAGNQVGYDDKTDDRLVAAGIPVYECTSEAGPYNAMHQKSSVFGLSDPTVVTDCGNWTKAALGNHRTRAKNDESYLFIDSNKLDDGATGRRFLSNYLYLLRTYEHQQDAGIPSADALIEKFQSHPEWPKVHVDFDVVAQTLWGQEVYITGDHPAFGTWTQDGPGIKLKTTGGSYPTWSTDTSIELPFGSSLEYKVVKRDKNTGELDWEDGPNQLLVVDSGDLNLGGADADENRVSVEKTFRE